jgi:3-deoxy-manno-octulosonate cytidylyltransferase (CMP-KDO synthetase)
MSTIGIIPARYASTRFPGKPLVRIGNKTMIQRVVERATTSQLFDHVLVATDDERIAQHVESLGFHVVMTSTEHQSGTDRCAEALEKSGLHADAIVNIQGDEPLVHNAQLAQLVALIAQPDVDIATLVKPLEDETNLFNANKVKVVINRLGRAMYFSRQTIPAQRGKSDADWFSQGPYYQHIGLYAFKTSVLQHVVQLPVSYLEKSESLEQLRWLEYGYNIAAGITLLETPAIDTPEDLEKLLKECDFPD